MGLVSTQAHVLGRDSKNYAQKETTAGTFVKATTGGSFNGKLAFQPNHKRKDLVTAYMASRDVLERITDKTEHSWSVEGRYVPSGAKGTAPDFGPFIEAAMGTETAGANDVTYSLNSNQTLNAISLTSQQGTELQQTAAGCLVEEMKFTFAGGEEPMFSASGRAMTYCATGRSTLNGAMAASATTMVVQAADAYAFNCMPEAYGVDPPTSAGGARSIITITDGVDTDNDVEVTASSAAPSFTVTAIGGAEQANAADVYPYVPTHTDAGSPISGVSGTFSWDSTTMVLQAAEFTLKNNWGAFDDEAGYQHMFDAVPGMREISGSLTFRVRRDFLIKILDRQEFANKALVITVGGAAQSGTRLVCTMSQCRPEFSEITIPDAEEATISLPFKALGSSGNDALTIMHT